MEGLLWWHWLCIGMGLMLLELLIPTFTISILLPGDLQAALRGMFAGSVAGITPGK